jgi:cellulose synthase/poly-beta-1,6-N-acetylglucosamine synthase-like glycosyltransferase
LSSSPATLGGFKTLQAFYSSITRKGISVFFAVVYEKINYFTIETMFFFNSLLTLLFDYFAFFISYLLILALAAIFFKPKNKYSRHATTGKFLVLIPAYKEDAVIVSTAEEALKQDYPGYAFDVCVIADKLQPDTLQRLRNLPIRTEEVFWEESTKARSINFVLDKITEKYNYVLILDADNVMGEGVLHKFNHALQSGFKAVQGHRTAKNRNTHFAVLDGLTEEVNNSLFRLGHRAVGLSSGLTGSGMAFDFDFYKNITKDITVSWEDKEVEFRIFEQNLTVEYIDEAWIYDEKVQNAAVYSNQRSRWLAGQFYSVKYYFFKAWAALFRGKLSYFDKWLQYLIPPRMILLGVLPFLAFICLIFRLSPVWWAWLGLWAGYIASILLAIPRRLYDDRFFGAMLQVPKAIFSLFLSLLRVKKAAATFVHTPHSTTAKE